MDCLHRDSNGMSFIRCDRSPTTQSLSRNRFLGRLLISLFILFYFLFAPPLYHSFCVEFARSFYSTRQPKNKSMLFTRLPTAPWVFVCFSAWIFFSARLMSLSPHNSPWKWFFISFLHSMWRTEGICRWHGHHVWDCNYLWLVQLWWARNYYIIFHRLGVILTHIRLFRALLKWTLNLFSIFKW